MDRTYTNANRNDDRHGPVAQKRMRVEVGWSSQASHFGSRSSNTNPEEVSNSALERYLNKDSVLGHRKRIEVARHSSRKPEGEAKIQRVRNDRNRNTSNSGGNANPGPTSENFAQTAISQLALAGKWTCQECTFHNDPAWLACGMCSSNRTTQKRDSSWECQICSYHNDPIHQFCGMCANNRTAQKTMPLCQKPVSAAVSTPEVFREACPTVSSENAENELEDADFEDPSLFADLL